MFVACGVGMKVIFISGFVVGAHTMGELYVVIPSELVLYYTSEGYMALCASNNFWSS